MNISSVISRAPLAIDAEADAGEDVGVVALARHEGLAVERHRIIGAAAGEQRACRPVWR